MYSQSNISKSKVLVFKKAGRPRRDERWNYGGVNLELVDKYVYLGLTVSNTGAWDEAIKKLMLRIFDSKVLPIMLYGSEIWRAYSWRSTEKAVTNFYRYLLKLKSNSPAVLARGKLGKHSVKVYVWSRVVNFWVDNVRSDPTSARRAAHNTQLRDLGNWERMGYIGTKHSSSHRIRGCVGEAGCRKTNAFKYLFKQRCTDIDTQEWQGKVGTLAASERLGR